MARDFVSCERGQLLLMPPSLVEWLPEDHLVWTVLGVVDQLDLSRFREGYRLGAAGRAPYDQAMLVALLLYAYARGNRSSRRGIEVLVPPDGAAREGKRPGAEVFQPAQRCLVRPDDAQRSNRLGRGHNLAEESFRLA
jgi:hypothetical protein